MNDARLTQLMKQSMDKALGDKLKAFETVLSKGVNVQLPNHLYIPEGAEVIDARKLCTISANTTNEYELFNFGTDNNEYVRFIAYSIFTDAEGADDVEFIPRLNGSRTLKYHGDPTDNFRISLGLAPDLSNYSLINCNIIMKPNKTLTWHVKNNTNLDIPMGVRMYGYVDNRNKLSESIVR